MVKEMIIWPKEMIVWWFEGNYYFLQMCLGNNNYLILKSQIVQSRVN